MLPWDKDHLELALGASELHFWEWGKGGLECADPEVYFHTHIVVVVEGNIPLFL